MYTHIFFFFIKKYISSMRTPLFVRLIFLNLYRNLLIRFIIWNTKIFCKRRNKKKTKFNKCDYIKYIKAHKYYFHMFPNVKCIQCFFVLSTTVIYTTQCHVIDPARAILFFCNGETIAILYRTVGISFAFCDALYIPIRNRGRVYAGIKKNRITATSSRDTRTCILILYIQRKNERTRPI